VNVLVGRRFSIQTGSVFARDVSGGNDVARLAGEQPTRGERCRTPGGNVQGARLAANARRGELYIARSASL
jgi:hypothetical protein